MCAAVGAALLSATCLADEIELTNGRKYQGLLIEREGGFVTFKAVVGSGTIEMMFPQRMVRSLKVDGKMPTPAPSPEPATPREPEVDPTRPVTVEPKPPVVRPTPTPVGTGRLSSSQINARIIEAGKTPPDWWDSVGLNYPSTLDLTGMNKAEGWAPQRNIGAFWYTVLNPNPGKWRGGIKVFDHCVKARKGNRRTLPAAQSLLARSYMRFEKDWARAAFWYRRMLARNPMGRQSAYLASSLAECYWWMGSKSMASGQLKKYQMHRFGSPAVVRLWGQMGESRYALTVARWLERRGGAGVPGYLAAGSAIRGAGKLPQARKYFQKAVDVGKAITGKGRPLKYIRTAEAAVEAVTLFEKIDLATVPDGTHTGRCDAGYRGPIEVEVAVKGGRIESARVSMHTEDMPFTSIKDTPASIVANQGLAGVDTITGATITCEAIINAAVMALAGAGS